MIAFVISVNGERTHTIGVGDVGVLSANLTWLVRPSGSGDLMYHLSGVDGRTEEHLYWAPLPEVKVGDTLSIQIIETDAVDTPIDRKTPAQLRQEDEELVTELEREQEALRSQKLDEEFPLIPPSWKLKAKLAQHDDAAKSEDV